MTAPSLREAAQMALDALECHTHSEESARCICCGHRGDCSSVCEIRIASDALRARLALPDADPVTHSKYGGPELQALILAKMLAPVERKPLSVEELDILAEKAIFSRWSYQQFARSVEAFIAEKGAA